MAKAESTPLIDPRLATDNLLETWLRSLPHIEEAGYEIVVGKFVPLRSSPKIAFIAPKDGELDIPQALDGMRKLHFVTPKGSVEVSPVVITKDQEKKLIETGKVKRVKFQLEELERGQLERMADGGTD